MSTQLELLIALLSLLAGVLFAWIAVQGWQPWRMRPGRHRCPGATPAYDFLDTAPGVAFHPTDNHTNQPAQ